MNILRGLLAGIIAALLGFVVPTVLLASYFLLKWIITGADEFERSDDYYRWWPAVVLPLSGIAIYLGCATWITVTLKGRYRFAPTLALLFIFSFFGAFVIGHMTDRAYAQGHFLLSLICLPIIVSTIIVVALGLASKRAVGVEPDPNDSTEPSTPQEPTAEANDLSLIDVLLENVCEKKNFKTLCCRTHAAGRSGCQRGV